MPDWAVSRSRGYLTAAKTPGKSGNSPQLDDLDVINGRRDQLEGKIQERYGIAKDQVRKDIDDWYNAQSW
jgi:hypothetical protein